MISSAGDLGRLVRRVRLSHGLTQRELAEQLDVTHRRLSELESREEKLANELCFDVLDRLGIRLFGEVDDA